MRVLISQRVFNNHHGVSCEYLEESYLTFFERFGIHLFPVSNFRTSLLSDYFSEFGEADGIILSGGNDVDPLLYREDSLSETTAFIRRDRTEKALVDYAVRKKIPVLGICRGMHFLNVYFGGSLIQNMRQQLNLHHPTAVDHPVTLIDPAARAFFQEDRWQTNSYHLQAVTPERLSPYLKAFAHAENGKIIEGLYHPDLPIAGVQFHPERTRDESQTRSQRKLIDAFVDGKLFWSPR